MLRQPADGSNPRSFLSPTLTLEPLSPRVGNNDLQLQITFTDENTILSAANFDLNRGLRFSIPRPDRLFEILGGLARRSDRDVICQIPN